MKKKMFGAFLTGALCLSLLAGCGSKADENPAEAMKERYSIYVDLGEYKGIQYTPTETPVNESDVESQLQRWLMNYGEEVHETTGMAVSGDKVGIDYVGTIDGVAFEGGDTKGAGTEITLGSSGYVGNFDDQIVGHAPGETFDVNVTFPENYGKEELNGKAAVFKTTLNYIVKTNYPELTDEFVAEKTDYDTVDAYRRHLQDDMVKSQAEEDLETDKEAMIKQVIDTSAVKQYPEKELKDRIANRTKQLEATAQSYNIPLDQYIMLYGYTAESFQEEIKTSTEEYIKRKMVVASIAAKENIEVSKAEADAKIQELLKASGIKDVNTLNNAYGYTSEDYYYIVLETKVMDFIYGNAVAKSGSAATEAGSTEAGSTEAASTESASTESASTEAASTEAASAEE